MVVYLGGNKGFLVYIPLLLSVNPSKGLVYVMLGDVFARLDAHADCK